jgi:4-hydroxy-tetrahydrodipicolinate reductase
MLRLALLGATGRMGQRILELALKDPELCVVSATGRNPTDLHSTLLECDVAIDFTLCQATKDHLEAALKACKPLVLGTTGHDEEQMEAIQIAAQSIPLLYSPNFSLGMALCLDAVSRFSKTLSCDYAVTILETHHAHKKDAPSGTARALAQAVKAGRGEGEVTIQSIRTGDVIGEHTVTFDCGHEKIELKHTAHCRDAFAAGALMAAKFLASCPPGLYTLKDLYR